ncbi:hypothetical protein BLOT_002253 [Blomia tropicalis]|nr:hypothetical protein BLOT_002253 [Blomia tropicalis]
MLQNKRKYWGLIVVCLNTRCIKVGVLESLSTSSAVCTFETVFQEVGYPMYILSENATNFLNIKKVIETSNMEVKWKTSTPLAPWMNGSSERLIRVVKNCLRIYDRNCKSLFEVLLRFKEAESICNSRPIIMSDRLISAHELVFGRPPYMSSLSTSSSLNSSETLTKLYKFNLDLRKRFSKLIRKRYFDMYRLSSNAQRLSREDSKRIKVGDFVLIPNVQSRSQWPSGQVASLEK